MENKTYKWLEWDKGVESGRITVDIGEGFPNIESIVRIECPECGAHLCDSFAYDFTTKKFLKERKGYRWVICKVCLNFSNYRRVAGVHE